LARNAKIFGCSSFEQLIVYQLIINDLSENRRGKVRDGMQEVIGSTPIFSTRQ